jgi:hypothetical protein
MQSKDKSVYVIGVDPGKTGALCLYNITTNKVVEVLNTPTYKKDKKVWLDGKKIYNKLQEWKLLTDKVIIETQVIMRGTDGTKSAQTTMSNFGYLLGILDSLEFVVEQVLPKTWQSSMLSDIPDPGEPVRLKPTKRKSLVFAKDINPKNDGISDAYTIACYYAKTHKVN